MLCRSLEADGDWMIRSEGDTETGIVSETLQLATGGNLVTNS